MLAAVVVATAAAVVPSGVAGAQATGGITLGQSTISPGGSTTATADFAGAGGVPQVEVSIVLTPVGTTTGSVTLSAPVSSGAVRSVCVPTPSGTQMDCLWDPDVDPQSGTLAVTVTASADAAGRFQLTSIADVDLGGGVVVGGPVDLVVSGALVTPAVTVSPGSVTPGATATATATFTVIATPTATPLRVAVDLVGTGGAGTLGSGTTTNLTNCTLDEIQRAYRCDMVDTAVGATATISIPVLASAGAVPGSTWTVEAYQQNPVATPTPLAAARLQIVAPEVTTTATTSPATSVAPSTVPGTPSPTLPVTLPPTGPAGGGLAAGLGLLALGTGAVLILLTRRASHRPH